MEAAREPNYEGLPRRYEETRPALDQVFTHSNILRIGEQILEKFEENSESQKHTALKDCEDRVWLKAEEYTNKCVKEALDQAANEEALRVKKIEQEHARHFAYEIGRIQDLMRQQCIEERYEERKDGERRMQEMAEELRKQFELEKMAEEKAARIEEQGIAEKISQERMRRHEKAKRALSYEMEEAKNSELKLLRFQLDDDRIASVEKAREDEHVEAERRVNEMEKMHQEGVEELNAVIRQLTEEKIQLELDLSSMAKQRDNHINKYKKLRKEFTGFIEECRPDFSAEQADFLLSLN